MCDRCRCKCFNGGVIVQKKLMGIVIGLLILSAGLVLSLNREDVVKQEKLAGVEEVSIDGIVETEFVSWDNFMMSDDDMCEISLTGNFDDDENVHVNVSSKKGEMAFNIGNAYDFSIHKSAIGEDVTLFLFTGIVKDDKNVTYVVKCEGDRFELKGDFNHVVDRLYTDGDNIYFYSNDSDTGEDSSVKLKYAYNLSEMTSAEVTDELVLEMLRAYEESY